MFFPAPKGHDQAGAALLFTLGTLTLLLSLGTAFIVNMMAENRQTEDFVRSLQARLAAQAGLERAICELRHAAESNYAAASNQPWFDNSPTQPTQPSYNCAASSGSGLLGTSARYTLHIIDTASRINLNDANPHLPALLDGLPGLGAALSQRIEDTRNTGMPNGRYAVASQVKWVNGIGDATYNGIENFVTASGYIDPNTMDLVAGTTSTYMASPRSPVNVNTASREVLSAVMEPFMNSAAEADRVADNLITWQQRSTAGTRVMGTWQDYETWRAAVTGLSTAEARNLSDNANPNRKNAWATGAMPSGAHASFAIWRASTPPTSTSARVASSAPRGERRGCVAGRRPRRCWPWSWPARRRGQRPPWGADGN